jgi:sialic acid synthase SpsE
VYKIGSGQSNDLDFLKYVNKKGKNIILSTGMSTFSDIKRSLSVLTVDVTLLHCVSKYPTEAKDADLARMQKMMLAFDEPVGYSDHTEGIDIALAAVALGANVIEKHITMDRRLPGPDQKCSIEPDELKCLIKSINRIKLACY